MLRPKNSRTGFLAVRYPSEIHNRISITVRQLWVCWGGATSLGRGRVPSLQLLLVLVNEIFPEPESVGAHDHTFLSQISDCLPSLEGQVSIFLYPPPGQGSPRVPKALVSLSIVSYYSWGYGKGIRTTSTPCLRSSCFFAFHCPNLGRVSIENAVLMSQWIFA
jgi:hypothetical protein